MEQVRSIKFNISNCILSAKLYKLGALDQQKKIFRLL